TMTTEALFEGRSFDLYGGWGFYFVRKYLADRHPSSHQDDPMKGFEDSVAGNYLPPGQAKDGLMVYDLNKIHNDPSRGRTVTVPDGANFKEITLHKAIIGGDPDDAEDLQNYPGCVLVNVPKHKIHAQDLLTNAIKNLGIGLYPTLCAFESDKNAETWKYSYPAQTFPTYKGKLPHCPWMLKIDEKTNLPVKDKNGEYIAIKTAGMPGTQLDVMMMPVFGRFTGKAFQYADKAFNSGGYTGSRDEGATDPNALSKYYAALSKGVKPLQFTFYVPVDFGKLNNHPIPNVEETADPQKIFTAHFNGGQEVW
ncbi:MAG TPA: DUF362 domain-containing protein, partial [Candidatus Atribacteria bacterium]|nr:DUF362 domain-containing protein [Candidatus Atribacteria bacterium]